MNETQNTDDFNTAWEWFAFAHPHEAYETDPERFWMFLHKNFPDVSRAQMKETLLCTA